MMKILFFILGFLLINTSCFSYILQYEPKVPDQLNINLSWKKLKTYLDHINELKKNSKSPIGEKYKNFFPSKVYFEDHKKNLQILPASSRITGDWQDHIDFKKNITSLKIKLRESNIGNIVKFRILLSSSRNINQEIFISSLFEVLGYPSIYRKKIKVSINGLIYEDMIFEESPVKEFLERNGYRESPIIEFDERQFWFKLNKLAEECSDKYSSRVVTKEFTDCYKNLQKQFTKKHQIIDYWKIDNAAFLKNSLANLIALDAIFSKKNNAIIDKFDKLSLYLGLDHSIRATHNRKFIYDPIYKILIPIYYDGNASNEKLAIFCQKNPNNKIKKKEIFFIEEKKRLEKIFKSRSGERLDDIMNCVANIVLSDKKNYFKKSEIFEESFLNAKYLIKKDDNPYTNKVYFNEKLSKFQICEINNNCQNLESKKLSTILAGNYPGSIINNNIFFPEIINKPKIKAKELKLNLKKENENILIKKNQTIYLNISKSTKLLDLIFEDSTSKAVIYNSSLQEINIKSNYLNPSHSNSEIRYDRNLLTGCLTIVDSELSKVNLYFYNAQCEDAINLIRSKGDIAKVSIKNSFSDALDLDFTKIKIKETEIVNSGNDCIDATN
jgi:hypothetical protein